MKGVLFMDALAIKESYMKFIEKNTQIPKTKGQKTEVVTPFINSTGESISFEVRADGKKYIITDNGYTYWDMNLQDINLNKKNKRRELLDSKINYYGFSINKENEIYKITITNELGQAIHDMTQLLLSIYDLTYLSQKNVYQQFFDDVKDYFNTNNQKYIFLPEFNLAGKSHLNHKFNYAFHSNGKTKLVKVFRTINKSQVESILASWLDTVEVRKSNYNDNEELRIIISEDGFNNLSDDYKLALENYNIKVVNFNDKKTIENEFAA